MSESRSDSMKTSEKHSVPAPDFAPIVRERRSPLILVLTLISAIVAAVFFFLASSGS